MLKKVLTSALMLGCYGAFAQQLEKEIRVIPDSVDKYTVTRGEFSYKSGEASYYLFRKKPVNLMKKSIIGGVSTGGGKKDLPLLNTYFLDKNLDVKSKEKTYYNIGLDPKEYTMYTDKVIMASPLPQEKPFPEMLKIYPDAFRLQTNKETTESLKVEYGASEASNNNFGYGGGGGLGAQLKKAARSYTFTFTKSATEYSAGCNCITYTENKTAQNFSYEDEPGAKLTANSEVKVNPATQNTLFTFFVKKEGAETYSEYKEFLFRVYDKERKLLNKTTATYDFAKNPFYTDIVYEENTNQSKKTSGYIVLMERYTGLGKKYNDPDRTSFNLVYLDNDGKEIFQYKFNYGTEKPSIQPYYSYSKDNNLYLFAKVVDAETQYVVFKFTKTGLESTAKFDPAFIKGNTFGNPANGIKSNYGGSFATVGHVNLSGGESIIYGYPKSTNMQMGALGTGVEASKEITTYGDYTFLLLSATGELKKQFVVEKLKSSFAHELYAFEYLFQDGNMIRFLVNQPVKNFTGSFEDAGIKSTIISIDKAALNASQFSVANPKFNGFFKNGYKVYPDLKKIALLGKEEAEKDVPEKYTIELIKF